MLVRQPLHNALLLTADINGQDKKGVRQGGGLSEDAQGGPCNVKYKEDLREKIDHHSLTMFET